MRSGRGDSQDAEGGFTRSREKGRPACRSISANSSQPLCLEKWDVGQNKTKKMKKGGVWIVVLPAGKRWRPGSCTCNKNSGGTCTGLCAGGILPETRCPEGATLTTSLSHCHTFTVITTFQRHHCHTFVEPS